jgi:hypothetical protein
VWVSLFSWRAINRLECNKPPLPVQPLFSSPYKINKRWRHKWRHSLLLISHVSLSLSREFFITWPSRGLRAEDGNYEIIRPCVLFVQWDDQRSRIYLRRSPGSSVDIGTMLRAGRSRILDWIPGRDMIFFSTASRSGVRPTQHPVQWVQGVLSPDAEGPWHGSVPSILRRNKECMELYLYSPIRLNDMIIKQRDNFTFNFT